ncbi:hypothetical protein ACO0LH_11795 [Undibacterium sp. TJN19]
MTCIHCTNLVSLQKFPQHAKTGYGACSLAKAPGHFIALRHTCPNFKSVDLEVAGKRDDWANRERI